MTAISHEHYLRVKSKKVSIQRIIYADKFRIKFLIQIGNIINLNSLKRTTSVENAQFSVENNGHKLFCGRIK